MTRMRMLLGGLLLCAAACAGCGYATNELLREDIQTVYIEFFDNTTFRRGLEVPLTQAVVAEVTQTTPLLLAPKDEAESILSGELVEVDETSSVKSETDRVLLRRVAVKVRFSWRDRLTGVEIVPPQTVTESVRATPTATDTGSRWARDTATDLRVQREVTSYDLVFREVARRVVERMQKPW